MVFGDPPYFPLSAKMVSPPLNFLVGGRPPEDWDGPSKLSARGRTRLPGWGGTEKDTTGDDIEPDGGTNTVGVGWREWGLLGATLVKGGGWRW